MAKNNFEPRSKFERWVRSYGGTEKLSDALKVSRPSVQNWLSGYCKPGIKTSSAILKLSKGKLSLSDILKAGE